MKIIGYLLVGLGIFDFVLFYCDIYITGDIFIFGDTYYSPWIFGTIGAVLLWLNNKKNKEEYTLDAELEKEILSEEGIFFKTTPKETLLSLTPKSQKLDEFSCKKGIIQIVNQKGDIFESPYNELNTKYRNDNYGIRYIIRSNNGSKVTIKRDEDILPKEDWDTIELIINPKSSFWNNFG